MSDEDSSTNVKQVPYLSRLEGNGFQPGQTLFIKGKRLAGEGFDLYFLTGQDHGVNDAPLILNAKFKDGKLVFNDRKSSKAGKEEKCKFSSKEGDPIDIRIRAHDNKFTVYANLKEAHQFEYRQPLTSINHLYIEGALELNDINWGGKYYPVPYQAGIDGGFTPGKKLILHGIPEKKAERFNVDFLTADGQTAFHFNPRFNKKNIVRNSFLNNTWGTEEAEGKFPFQSDQCFEVMIVNEPYAFQCFVNGVQFCAFAHRNDPSSVKGLKIEGDIELHGVHVK